LAKANTGGSEERFFHADRGTRDPGRPKSLIGAAVIVAIWVAAAALLLWWFWPAYVRYADALGHHLAYPRERPSN
jgi:hypothetical protein